MCLCKPFFGTGDRVAAKGVIYTMIGVYIVVILYVDLSLFTAGEFNTQCVTAAISDQKVGGFPFPRI